MRTPPPRNSRSSPAPRDTQGARGVRAHFAALDGWRGIAAVMVALYHWRGQIGFQVNSNIGQLGIVQNGYLFVDFFFVLSGFVIAATYQERLIAGAVRFRDFVILRLGRLVPLHLFTLVLMAALVKGLFLQPHEWIDFRVPPEDVSLRSFVLNALLLQGMHTTPLLTWNHPSWSISVEFFTYLTFAAAWLALKRRAVWFAWTVAALAPVAILKLAGQMDVTYDWGFPRALFGFAMGAIVFSGRSQSYGISGFAERRGADAATLLELAAVAGAGAFVWFAEATATIAAPVIFAFVVAIFAAERGYLSRLLALRPSQALGRWSYSIYLLQFPLQELLMFGAVWAGATQVVDPLLLWLPGDGAGRKAMLGATPLGGDLSNLLMLALLIGASAITYRWVEAPGRAWARRAISR